MTTGNGQTQPIQEIKREQLKLSPEQRRNLEIAEKNSQVLIDRMAELKAAGIEPNVDMAELKAGLEKIKALLRLG